MICGAERRLYNPHPPPTSGRVLRVVQRPLDRNAGTAPVGELRPLTVAAREARRAVAHRWATVQEDKVRAWVDGFQQVPYYSTRAPDALTIGPQSTISSLTYWAKRFGV